MKKNTLFLLIVLSLPGICQSQSNTVKDSLVELGITRLHGLLDEAEDSVLVADLCIAIYRLYKFKLLMENPHESTYLMRALRNYETAGQWDDVAYVHNALAGMYYNRNQMFRARENWEKALELYSKTGNIQRKAVMYNNLSLVYARDSSEEGRTKMKGYLEQASEIYLEIEDFLHLASTYTNLGSWYRFAGDFKNAELYYRRAIALAKQTANPTTVQAATFHLGVVRKAQRRYREAISLIEESLSYQSIRRTDPNVLDAYKALADLNRLVGNFESAFNHQLEYQQIKDTLFHIEQAKKLLDLETTYETEKKEQQIIALKEKEEIQSRALQAEKEGRLYLTIFSLVSLIGLITIGLLYRKVSLNRKKVLAQNKELEKLNATKNRFFGIIAHDLRGPVTALQGITGLLNYNIRKGNIDSLDKIARQIEESAVKVNVLLDNLLKWALSQEGTIPYRPQTLTLKPLVKECLEHFNDMASTKNISLSMDISDDLHVCADREMLSTVLRNLVNNSVKFTPDGGLVTLSARNGPEHVQIEVADNGRGIEKEKIEKLFLLDDHKTTAGTNAEKGTGLGLVLVHDFVRMNKGTISVDSRVSSGSVFAITLPSQLAMTG